LKHISSSGDMLVSLSDMSDSKELLSKNDSELSSHYFYESFVFFDIFDPF
jgi:hypothetical protein